MNEYMVYTNWAGATFVKERRFFIEQGGERDAWGQNWQLVKADSIGDARKRGREMAKGTK